MSPNTSPRRPQDVRRTFKGNWNYLSYYNKCVADFFGHENEQFAESKVTLNSVHYANEHHYRQKRGVVWTSQEKNVFFRALARHSIHRVDLIHEQLPTKTEIDIYVYYHHLKTTVAKLKKGALKYQVVKGSKKYYHQGNDMLVKYQDMPFSYEMSRWFLKFEQVQAKAILQKEARLDADVTSKHLRCTTELIDKDALTRMMQLYVGLGYTEQVLTLPYRTVRLFERLVELKVRQIVLQVMQRNREVNVVRAAHIQRFADVQTNPLDHYLYRLGRFDVMGIEQQELFRPSEFYPMKTVHPNNFTSTVEGPQMGPTGHLSVDSLPRYDVTSNQEEDFDQLLFEQETKMVDDHDIKESQNHEHVLLTYFATCDRKANEHTMYSDDIMSILTYEDLVEQEELDAKREQSEESDTEPAPKRRKRLGSMGVTPAESTVFKNGESTGSNSESSKEASSNEELSDSDSLSMVTASEQGSDLDDDFQDAESQPDSEPDSEDSDLETTNNDNIDPALLTNYMQSYASY